MSSIIVPYFTGEMRSEVLRMLGLRQDGFKKGMVRVRAADKEDSGNKRIILHYDVESLENLQAKPSFTEKERNEIGALAACRGVIIDLDTMQIIKRSYPQTINIPTAFVPLHMNAPILTANGDYVPEWGQYKSYYGGTLLHAYFYKGKVYMSTFSHFDASNSHFGDSDNFVSSFLKNQSIFKDLSELFPVGSDHSVIHIFILNDRKLLVDTRENQDEDRVVYLKSFSLTDRNKIVNLTEEITKANAETEKPISFCKILSPQEVNERLRGKAIDVSDNYDGDRNQLLWKFQNFFGGEKVIYEHTWGICTLVPPSCKYRQQIMEGKNNINKLFVDCMADFKNEKGLSDIAFGMDDCFEIAEKIQMGETIYVDEYQIITDNKQLQVLTNLLFVVPLNRIPEVISAYKDFDEKLLRAACYLIDYHDELEQAINDNGLTTYPGITSKKFRDYLCEYLPNLHYNDYELNDFWPEVLKKKFASYYKQVCNPDIDQEQQILLQVNMGLVALVGNAYGDILYTLLTFEEKSRKAKVAAEKRASR